MQRYPIHEVVAPLCAALRDEGRAVLAAPPGSGKTTIIPLELLERPWLAGRKILLLEPRRLAARACASRMADLLGEPLGETVGYRIRFDNRVSARTRIEVVTEGILTRQLQRDPELSGVGLVIFDEFHERNLHGDLALALALEVATGLRDDLRLLVMSATLDTGAVSRMLDNAPVIEGRGQSYPVDIRYAEREPQGGIAQSAANGVLRAIQESADDVLLFLPGVGEIRAVESALAERLPSEILICPLYGDLSREQQDRAIQPDPGGRRRVVLATAIAETSLTIEGVATVVDSGWTRQPGFNPNSGLTRLETQRVSLASADQRAGRAGRLGPGVCYRLWTRATQSQLRPAIPPEILAADLTGLVLELAQWGVKEASELRWLDPPPPGSYAQSLELLQLLGAVDRQGRITGDGSRMLALGVDPRLGRMLLVGARCGQAALAADLAALLTEKDLLPRREGSGVDIERRLDILQLWRDGGERPVRSAGADSGACRQVERTSRQLQKRLSHTPADDSVSSTLSCGGLLALAFPDRIAGCRSRERGSYQMVLGRRVTLPPGDLLSGQDFIVAAQLDAGRSEGRVFLAAAITLAEIRTAEQASIQRRARVEWDVGQQAVVALEEELLGRLVLAERPLSRMDPQQILDAMLQGIRREGLQILPWDASAEELRARVAFLRRMQPEAGWPDLADEALLQGLEEWLAPWLAGIARRDQLKRLNLQQMLLASLSWEQQQALDRLAPTHVSVPSGSRKRIDYLSGDPPVLAVRLQEMFGSLETPAICEGQVPLMLHLLSPAQRPIQVTRDLPGFWSRTYAEVRKELKGRYPKHYWPDDPLQAEPTARAKPRKG